MKGLKKIFFIPVIICILFSSLSLYSCVNEDEPAVRWHYGEDEPADSIAARVGDFYFEYGDCDVYTYTSDGWEYAFNMKGTNGKNGENGENEVR